MFTTAILSHKTVGHPFDMSVEVLYAQRARLSGFAPDAQSKPWALTMRERQLHRSVR